MKPIALAWLCLVAGLVIMLSGAWNLGLFADGAGRAASALSRSLAIIQIGCGPAFFAMAVGHFRRSRS